MEGFAFDGGEALRKGDRGEVGAAVQGIPSDGGDTLGEADRGEGGAIHEGGEADGADQNRPLPSPLVRLDDDALRRVAEAVAVPFPPAGLGRLSAVCRAVRDALLHTLQQVAALRASIAALLRLKCSWKRLDCEVLELPFHWTGLDPADCHTLGELLRVEALPKLTTLSLYQQPLVGPQGMQALVRGLRARGALATLQELNLYRCTLGAEGAAALAPALAALPGLERLFLADNAVGDVGMASLALPLAALHGLRVLSLSDNGIGDEGLEALLEAVMGSGVVAHRREHRLPVLKELVLFRNAVGDAGCASLVAFLQCGFLPCLCCPEHFLQGCPASEAARQAVVRTIRRRP